MAFNHCFVCPVGLYVAGSVFRQGVKLNRFFKANSGLTLKNGKGNLIKMAATMFVFHTINI